MIFSLRKIFFLWVKRDPAKAFITMFVGLAHFTFILMICFYPLMHKKKAQQKLVVKTFQAAPKSSLQEKKKQASAPKDIAGVPPKPAAEKKKPILAPAKPETAALAAKKPVPSPKPVAKPKPSASSTKPAPAKQTPSKQQPKSASTSLQVPKELLEELEERIAKIETKRDKIQAKADIDIPKSIDSSFSKETIEYSQEDDAIDELNNYSDFLVAYLQQHLHLPDFGEVKVEIILRQDGAIEKYVVLKTESEKNRRYLEERLPSLRFPEFKEKGLSKGRQAFVLTFCNEI